MCERIFGNPLTGIFLTAASFRIGIYLNQKLKNSFLNPLLVSVILIGVFMKISGMSYEQYMEGGTLIRSFMLPATAALGLSVYRKRAVLKEQFLPIVSGCAAGSICSMGSTLLLCNLFRIRPEILNSLLPKSVTTAIAIDLSKQLGGIESVTVLAVLVCGIGGAILHPLLIRVFRLGDPVAIGVAIGTSSHAVGTAKAVELGEVEGAVSGVAMGVSGIVTVLFVLLAFQL